MVKLTAVDLKTKKCIAQVSTNAWQGSKRYRKADRKAQKFANDYRRRKRLPPNRVAVHTDILFPFPGRCTKKVTV